MKSAAEQIADMKETVEDLIRHTVKKADQYHMIQVSPFLLLPSLSLPPFIFLSFSLFLSLSLSLLSLPLSLSPCSLSFLPLPLSLFSLAYTP
jgi:hypothetical protein